MRDQQYTIKFPHYKKWIRRRLRLYKRYGRLFLKITFYFRGLCKQDIDNMLVPLLNVLSGHWMYDDAQVKHLLVEVREFDRRFGIYIQIGVLP